MNILVTGARAPIAADLAQALHLTGHRVWMLDSLRWPIAAGSPYCQKYVRTAAPRESWTEFANAVLATCERFQIGAIIPTSEEVFWLAALRQRLPSSVSMRTSDFATLARLHDKAAFAEIATSLGYGAPENRRLTSLLSAQAVGDSGGWVFKPVFSRFATSTLVGPSAKELLAIEASPARPWLAQTRIQGDEYCLYNVADKGRLLYHVAYQPIVRFGKGASIYFDPVARDDMRTLSARFVEETKFTGQISFDVIDDGRRLVAIECNPRGTSGVHLAAQNVRVFVEALLGRAGEPDTVAVAPRMLLGAWLLQSPGTLFRPGDRALRAGARDALSAAQIGSGRQMLAVAEMAYRAFRARTSVAAASTLDIEWNGEDIDA